MIASRKRRKDGRLVYPIGAAETTGRTSLREPVDNGDEIGEVLPVPAA
jgi:hypothetical protein